MASALLAAPASAGTTSAGTTSAGTTGTDEAGARGTVATSSSASALDGPGKADDCEPHAARLTAAAPAGIARPDGPSEATVRAYERDLRARLARLGGPTSARGLIAGDVQPRTRKVKVFVHVLKPTQKAKRVSGRRIRKQIRVLNRAYAGRQWRRAENARFRFELRDVDVTTNKSWYRAELGSRASKRMRRQLHRGGTRALNLYIGKPEAGGGMIVLGYASFPQKAAKRPRLDGVVIHRGSMRGGGIRGYNRGDTTVHEVGHWLGLYHTFHGGCSKRNDRVADTPAEAVPSFRCPTNRDSCAAEGDDPVRNFMDYSFDSCMHHFTAGQIARMHDSWRAYRR
ncbi:UNVERIFIED_CONTAM: hypothetical protein LK11_58215 [Mumia flava]